MSRCIEVVYVIYSHMMTMI